MSRPRPFLVRMFDEAYNDPILWKGLFTLFAVINIALLVGLLHLLWHDPVFYATTTAILLGVAFGYLELEAAARWLGSTDEPALDWTQRLTWIMTIGYGLVLVLAVVLTWYQSTERTLSEQRARQAEREKAERHRLLASPEVQRANQFLEQRRAAQETQPAP